jgi:RimJ/RimL family protein N-acetyltransferase
MADIHVREIQPADAGAVDRFVSLEREWMAPYRYFYSESDSDVRTQLSGQSTFFDGVSHTLFVASDGSEDVARCVALCNPRYQDAKQEAVGCIGYFAAAADREAHARALLHEAEAWLSRRAVTRVLAPFNGSVFLGCVGVRTSAFAEPPCYPFGWHPPYYADYLSLAGYEPTYPLLTYDIELSSAAFRDAAAEASRSTHVEVRTMAKGGWDTDIDVMRRVLNETFVDEWEYCPTTKAQIREALDPLRPVVDARSVLFAEIEGETAGFCCGLPDWAPLFRSFRGRMGPVQKVRFLWHARRCRQAGLIMIGIRPGFRGHGVGKLLATRLFQHYAARGLSHALYHIVNEANTASRRLAESLGGRGRVLHHGFDKRL